MVNTWPVVRREAEYAAIYSALVGQGEVGGIVVIGDAGVGKTTLARLVTQSLPCPVHWVVGTESAGSIPLGVFADLIGSAIPSDPMVFLAATREAILAQGQCVIGVDDAHLLDELSATLLHRLAIEGLVRIVATVRSGETAPDAITSLWKDGYLRRLDLAPFSKDECVGLIEQTLGGRLEGLSADRMWQASGGNALFVRHLVEGAVEAGTLRQVRGVWQLRGRTAVTSELAALLDARIEQLPDDVVHMLELLSFCEPLDLDTLTGMVGADAVECAERRGLIRVVAEQHTLEARFIHPLFGEVIRRRLGVAAARRLRGELVRILREQPIRGPEQRIRLAELTLDSDEKPQTDLLVAAAQDAITLTNIPLGERLARAAVTQGGGLVASELLARAQLWQGNAAEAEQTLSPFDPDKLSEVELLRWGAVRIANLHWLMGDTEGARELLDLLRERVTHPGARLSVDGLAAATTMSEGHLEEAVRLCERVLADPAACPQATECAVIGGTIALALMGRLDQVAVVAARAHQVEDRVEGLLRHLAAFGEISGLVFAGQFRHRRATLRQHRADLFPGQYLAWGMGNVLAGTVEVARGRFPDAVSRMEQTVAALESTPAWGFSARLLLAQSYCALGRVELTAKWWPSCEPGSVAIWRCLSRSCGSPRRGWPPRRDISAPRSSWLYTPARWPDDPGSARSNCAPSTMRSALVIAHRCSASLTSPPVWMACSHPSTARMRPRWPTAMRRRSTRRPNGSSGSVRCCRPPTPPPRPPCYSRPPVIGAARCKRPRQQKGWPPPAGASRPQR